MELGKQEHGYQNQRHMGDASGAHASTSTLHSPEPAPGKARGGATQDEYGKFGMDEEQQDEVLIFPEGEQDAVTITRNDMEGLQPGGSLSGNIVDFYNKYLQSRLRPTIKDNVHIFNTYFFTKLVEIGGLPEEQRDAAYERVLRWAGNVNIFERKFVFIPVYESSHWSLIIVCNLSSLTNAPDKRECAPCILHLDSVEGKHENLEEHILGYIMHAWLDRHQKPNVKQLLALRGMKYVEWKVPQQENDYDCGIYLVCFIELFLRGSLNVDFVPNQESLFTSLGGTVEVSAKRRYIKYLIWELRLRLRRKSWERETGLSELYEGRPVSRVSDVLETNLDGNEGRTENLQMHYTEQMNFTKVDDTEFQDHQMSVEVALDSQQHTKAECSEHLPTDENMIDFQRQPRVLIDFQSQVPRYYVPSKHDEKKKERRKRRKWSHDETSILLTCMMERGRFCKGDQATTNWIAISEEIAIKLPGSGPMPTEDQCRLRYDTLLKAYKKCKEQCTITGKQCSDLQQGGLKLATILTGEWYRAMDEICRRSPQKARSTAHGTGYTPVESIPISEAYNPPSTSLPWSPPPGPFPSTVAGPYMLRNLSARLLSAETSDDDADEEADEEADEDTDGESDEDADEGAINFVSVFADAKLSSLPHT